MNRYTTLAGRLLMGQIFLFAGISKIGAYSATQQWMEATGVPGLLLPAVILLEVGGALALIFGLQTRRVAWGLAGFSIMAAGLFHNNLADQMQSIMFMKNLAMAGGLLFIAAHGAGGLSLDAHLEAQRKELQPRRTLPV